MISLLTHTIFISIISAITFILLIFLLDLEKNKIISWISSCFIIFIISIFWKDIKNLDFNIMRIILFVFIYFVTGIVWSIFKWTLTLSSLISSIKTYKIEFEKSKGSIDDNWKLWCEKVRHKFDAPKIFNYADNAIDRKDLLYKIIPKAKNKKASITIWILHWPISVVSTIINHPLKIAITFIYESISGVYDKISNYIAKRNIDKL